MKKLILSVVVFFAMGASLAFAGPLSGKSYIIQMSSPQYKSGYAHFLVPPLSDALRKTDLIEKSTGADIVVNVITHSDVGKWVKTGKGRQWLYTSSVTIGISPSTYEIPYEGTPQFGAKVSLLTLNADREGQVDCMIALGVKVAVEKYQPKGIIKVDGSQCLRQ